MPVQYDMDDSKSMYGSSTLKTKIVRASDEDSSPQPTSSSSSSSSSSSLDKFDLGTLVLSKIIEQMKSLNTSVNASTVAYDKNVSTRAGLPMYTVYLDETMKDKRTNKIKIYGKESRKKEDKKQRYTLPNYF